MNYITNTIVNNNPLTYLLNRLKASAVDTPNSANAAYFQFINRDIFHQSISPQFRALKEMGNMTLNSIKTTFYASLCFLNLPGAIHFSAFNLGQHIGDYLYPEKPDLKRPLKVKVIELNDEMCPKTIKTLEAWERVAFQKTARSKTQGRLFSDNSYIARRMIGQITDDKPPRSAKIFICYDRQHKIPQAMAFVVDKPDNIYRRYNPNNNCRKYKYVEWLVTNPINIRDEVNDREKYRVTGAATAILAKLGSICLKESMEQICLESLISAEPFYTKLGFVPDPASSIRHLALAKENFITCKQLEKNKSK